MEKEGNNNSGLQAVAYEAPVVEVIEVEVERGFAVTGLGEDSDDSEFGGAPERRGTWGNLWE